MPFLLAFFTLYLIYLFNCLPLLKISIYFFLGAGYGGRFKLTGKQVVPISAICNIAYVTKEIRRGLGQGIV